MIFSLKPYTYEDFEEVTVHVLGRRYNIKPDLAIVIASSVWHKMGTPNIRQCLKIAKMTKKKGGCRVAYRNYEEGPKDSGEDWNE